MYVCQGQNPGPGSCYIHAILLLATSMQLQRIPATQETYLYVITMIKQEKEPGDSWRDRYCLLRQFLLVREGTGARGDVSLSWAADVLPCNEAEEKTLHSSTSYHPLRLTRSLYPMEVASRIACPLWVLLERIDTVAWYLVSYQSPQGQTEARWLQKDTRTSDLSQRCCDGKAEGWRMQGIMNDS